MRKLLEEFWLQKYLRIITKLILIANINNKYLCIRPSNVNAVISILMQNCIKTNETKQNKHTFITFTQMTLTHSQLHTHTFVFSIKKTENLKSINVVLISKRK